MGKDKPTFKEVFILFKSERKQFAILTIIVLLLILARYTRPYFYQEVRPSIEELESRIIINEKKEPAQNLSSIPRKPIKINLAENFDWQQLGFSSKQAKVIVEYRERIDGFKSVNDVAKIFIIDSIKFQEILPFLNFDKAEVSRNQNAKIHSKELLVEDVRKWNLSKFDPNNVTNLEMVDMGFNESEINNIINYRNKVGAFLDSTDFKKLYAFSNLELQKVLPFVLIVDDTISNDYVVAETVDTDINKCDSLFLISLKGIGPYYAKLILAYRDKLGGFIDLNQLYEINKIPSETIDKCISNFKIEDGFEPRKMNVNSKDFKMFMHHPYFSYAHTKKIFDYRNLKGKYASLQELNNIAFIDSKYVERVSPYLKVE